MFKNNKLSADNHSVLLSTVFIILIPIILSIMVRYDFFNRWGFEIYMQIVAVLIILGNLNIKVLYMLLTIASLSALHSVFSSSLLGFVSMSILPIAIIFFNKGIVSKRQVDMLMLLAFVNLIVSTLQFVTGDFVEDGTRISGIFNSSLHTAYFSIFLAAVVSIYAHGIKKYFYLASLLATGALTGSRAAFIGVFIVLLIFNTPKLLHLKWYHFLLFILVLVSALMFVGDIRVLSYVPNADALRLHTYSKFFLGIFDISSINSLLFGHGRVFYGATGHRFLGADAFITESSFVMFLYSFGILFGMLMYSSIFIRLFSFSDNIRKSIFYLFVLFMSMLSPFFDSPSILVINMILLNAIVNSKKIISNG